MYNAKFGKLTLLPKFLSRLPPLKLITIKLSINIKILNIQTIQTKYIDFEIVHETNRFIVNN